MVGSALERARTTKAWLPGRVSLPLGGWILIGIGALSPGKSDTLGTTTVYQVGSRFSISMLYWSTVVPAFFTSAIISTGSPPAAALISGGVRLTTIGSAAACVGCVYISMHSPV